MPLPGVHARDGKVFYKQGSSRPGQFTLQIAVEMDQLHIRCVAPMYRDATSIDEWRIDLPSGA